MDWRCSLFNEIGVSYFIGLKEQEPPLIKPTVNFTQNCLSSNWKLYISLYISTM